MQSNKKSLKNPPKNLPPKSPQKIAQKIAQKCLKTGQNMYQVKVTKFTYKSDLKANGNQFGDFNLDSKKLKNITLCTHLYRTGHLYLLFRNR